jgi:AcrR family transcriptional regulator
MLKVRKTQNLLSELTFSPPCQQPGEEVIPSCPSDDEPIGTWSNFAFHDDEYLSALSVDWDRGDRRTALTDLCDTGQVRPRCSSVSSTETAMARERVRDRRVRKTQGRLREALVELLHEKRYDAIVVKEILDRADVGRTAFYSHFEDKHALLASGIRQILYAHPSSAPARTTRPFHRVLWFSRPVFEYLNQFRHRVDTHMDRKGRAIVHEHLRHVLVEEIAEDVKAVVDSRAGRPPAALMSEYIVTTFLLVVNWWIENGQSLSPQDADEVFLRLVVPVLRAQTQLGIQERG